MDFVIGFILGFLLAYVAPLVNVKRCRAKTKEPTDEEKRRAEKALREYQNFMNYDGFASTDEDNT